jgi:hypothetical protein
MITLASLPAGGLARFRFVILANGVESALLGNGAANIEAKPAGQVENPDHRVGELDLDHRPVREIVVGKAPAVALHRLRNLFDDKH